MLKPLKIPNPHPQMLTEKTPLYIHIDSDQKDEYGKYQHIQTIFGLVNPDGTIYGEDCRVCLYLKYLIIKGVKHRFYQTFQGKFNDGLLSGEGQMVLRNSERQTTVGNISFTGSWSQGLMNGRMIIHNDKIKLIGNWINGKFDSSKQVIMNWLGQDVMYGGQVDNNFIVIGKGTFKTKKYKSLQGYFHKSIIYDKNANYQTVNGITYHGGMLKDRKHGFGVECKYDETCTCCGKLYREKYNLKTDTLEEIEKVKKQTTWSGYWFYDKIVFSSNKKMKCCGSNCNEEPTICSITSQKVFCNKCFDKTHTTPKMKKHKFFYLDPKHYLKLDEYDDTNPSFTLEELDKKKAKSIKLKKKSKRKRKSSLLPKLPPKKSLEDIVVSNPYTSKIDVTKLGTRFSSCQNKDKNDDELIAKYKQIKKEYKELNKVFEDKKGKGLDDAHLKLMEEKIKKCAPLVERLEELSKAEAASDFEVLLNEMKTENGGKNFVFKNH